MIKKTVILDKIKEFYGFKTDTEFANFLNIKQNTLSNWRSRNSIDYDLLISKCENLNANWLHTGKGNMFKDLVNEESPAYGTKNKQKDLNTRIENLEHKYEELQKNIDAIARTIKIVSNN